MARKKKIITDNDSDDQKVENWLKNNKVSKIANNICGPVITKSFFQRKRKPQVPVTEERTAETVSSKE